MWLLSWHMPPNSVEDVDRASQHSIWLDMWNVVIGRSHYQLCHWCLTFCETMKQYYVLCLSHVRTYSLYTVFSKVIRTNVAMLCSNEHQFLVFVFFIYVLQLSSESIFRSSDFVFRWMVFRYWSEPLNWLMCRTVSERLQKYTSMLS